MAGGMGCKSPKRERRQKGHRIRLTSIRHGMSQEKRASDKRESQDMQAGGYGKKGADADATHPGSSGMYNGAGLPVGLVKDSLAKEDDSSSRHPPSLDQRSEGEQIATTRRWDERRKMGRSRLLVSGTHSRWASRKLVCIVEHSTRRRRRSSRRRAVCSRRTQDERSSEVGYQTR